MNRRQFCSVVFVTFATVNAAFADNGSWPFYRDAYLTSREMVLSGECDVTFALTDMKSGNVRETSFFVAFDKSQERVRFDRLEGEQVFRSARTPEFTLLYSPQSGLVEKRSPTHKSPSHEFRPFDVAITGMITLPEWETRWNTSDLAEFLSTIDAPLIARQGDGLVRLTWSFAAGPDSVTRIVWLNEERGHTPQKLELNIERINTTLPTPMAAVETEWQQNGNVWVPKSCQLLERFNDRKVVMTFDWKSANVPVSDEVFSASGFGLPGNTPTVNMQLGKPIVESTTPYVGDLGQGIGDRGGSFRKLVIGVNAVLIVVLVVAWIVYTRRR